MSNTVQCDTNKEDVADDWEDAGADALVASVAERQKRVAREQTQMAVEQQQLKIEPAKLSVTDKRPDLSSGPVRLLRRPQSGSQLKQKSDAELAKEAEERALKALEEREAAYQQAREKIFGGEQQQPQEQQVETNNTSESVRESDSQANVIEHPVAVASTSTTNSRDHLSDVPMKRADTCRPPNKAPIPPPPISQPMVYQRPPWGYPHQSPVPYAGIPPGNYGPYFGPPVTSSIPMGYQPPPQFGPLNPYHIPPNPPIQKNQQQKPIPLAAVNVKSIWNNQSTQNMGIPPMLGQVQYHPPYNYSQPKNSTRFQNQ